MSYANERIYLDDVTLIDEAEGCFNPEINHRTGSKFYTFRVRVTPEDYEKARASVSTKISTMGSDEPFVFTEDTTDGRCYEEQLVNALRERYGVEKAKRLWTPGGLLAYRPMDCLCSAPELRLIHFKQLDPPVVNGAKFGENLINRVGNIQFHLNEYENGQIFGYCDYLNLTPIEDDYVPSGNDDGGLF